MYKSTELYYKVTDTWGQTLCPLTILRLDGKWDFFLLFLIVKMVLKQDKTYD
jgi:hypothetical protein